MPYVPNFPKSTLCNPLQASEAVLKGGGTINTHGPDYGILHTLTPPPGRMKDNVRRLKVYESFPRYDVRH